MEVCSKQYMSSIFQAFAMCFFNNAALTMQLIQNQNQTTKVFGDWFAFMRQFTMEIELKRVILGLVCILKNIAPDQMPSMIRD